MNKQKDTGVERWGGKLFRGFPGKERLTFENPKEAEK